MTTRKFFNRPIRQPVPPERIESGPDLPVEEAALARNLRTLAQAIQPDPDFVARLEQDLARKRLAPRPAPKKPYPLLQNLRVVMQSAWGWTLPAAAVILLILVISLLVQMRPRHVIPSSVLTSTAQNAPTATPTPLPSPTATIYIVQEGDTLLKIAELYGVPVAAIYEANPVLSEGVLRPGMALVIPLEGRAIDTPVPTLANVIVPGEQVPFEICGESVTWTRPTEGEQKTKWWDDGRYVGGDDEYTKYPWIHDFLVAYGQASVDYDLINLSGLWTLAEDIRAKCIEPTAHDAVLRLQKAEVWVLLHQVIRISRVNSDYYIVVEPTTKGVQFIQFARPQQQLPLTMHFVLENGQELERIVESESLYWPYPQLAETPSKQPTATPASTSEALLAEMSRLVEQRRATLLTGPGWIYVESDRTDTEQGGQMLPNGRQVPPQYMEYSWYQVDEQGNVHASITRQIDYSDQIYQVIVTRNGVSRNMTFSFENTAPLTTVYEADWGFAASTVQALTRGASLRQADSEQGNFVLLLEEDDAQRGGNLQKYATFDPQTGNLLELSTWLDVPCGDTEFDCGAGQLEGMILKIEQRVDQPPADVLALLDQPTPPYQPIPPQGEAVPPGFDLAHSLLTFQTFAGDDFYNPTFSYGDIYADSTYLVGRVDFGAVPGGFCQRSPDGLKLAFDRATLPSDATATHQLRWLELSNPGEVQAVLPELQLVSPPVWGPDSTRLAFVACDATQSCGLYTYAITSGALQWLAEGGNATPPVWSPVVGTQIAYQARAGEAPQTVVVEAASGRIIASPGWHPQFLADWSGFSQCELAPALSPTLPEAPADWLVYTNAAYGFNFRYPPDATLEETANTVKLSRYDQQGGELVLDIGFLRPGEQAEVRNGWLGMADMGDLAHGGHISLLGQSLIRHTLVYEGKAKAVLYGQAARDGMIFSFRLDDYSLDYYALDLSVELQRQVNQIIESFAWIPAGASPVTPTPPPPDAQALLAELQRLVARRTGDCLASPGWILRHTWITNAAICGAVLPNGAFTPCEIDEVSWYEVNARGEIVTVITNQYDPSGGMFQIIVTRDGLTRNLTFAYETPAPLTTSYEADWGFAATAAEAVARGASLSQASSSIDGEFSSGLILLLADGDMQREAVFNLQTGALLWYAVWKTEQDGMSQTESVKTINEMRVDQPPEEVLAYLDQPTPP